MSDSSLFPGLSKGQYPIKKIGIFLLNDVEDVSAQTQDLFRALSESINFVTSLLQLFNVRGSVTEAKNVRRVTYIRVSVFDGKYIQHGGIFLSWWLAILHILGGGPTIINCGLYFI